MSWLKNIINAQTQRKFADWRAVEEYGGDSRDSVPLKPNETYFQFRLCEMYLRDARIWGSDFVPRLVAITDCTYSTNTQLALPKVVCDAERGNNAGSEVRELGTVFENILLSGPLPYRGDELEFFVALYGIKIGSVISDALNLFEDVSADFGLELSPFTGVASKISKSLPAILSNSGIEQKIGMQMGFNTTDRAVDGDHYLLLINEDSKKIRRETLAIEDDKLYETTVGGSRQRYEKHDFCLIRFVCREFRDDYTTFSFTKKFDTARKFIFAKELAKTEWAISEMIEEIVTCPELTDRHKRILTISYALKLEEWPMLNGISANPWPRHAVLPASSGSGPLHGSPNAINWAATRQKS